MNVKGIIKQVSLSRFSTLVAYVMYINDNIQ